MKIMQAGAVLAALLAAGVTVTGCGPKPPVIAMPTSSTMLSSPPTAPPSMQENATLLYQGTGVEYLMHIIYSSSGGPVGGTVTVGVPCLESDNSTGLLSFGPYQIIGTYHPGGDAEGNEFDFNQSTADIGGSVQEVIGDLSGSISATSDNSDGLVFDSSEDWTPGSQSDFTSSVESMNDVLAYCNS